jgi:hypothetical protein
MLSCRERSYQEQIEILKEQRKKAIIGLCLLSSYKKLLQIFLLEHGDFHPYQVWISNADKL